MEQSGVISLNKRTEKLFSELKIKTVYDKGLGLYRSTELSSQLTTFGPSKRLATENLKRLVTGEYLAGSISFELDEK